MTPEQHLKPRSQLEFMESPVVPSGKFYLTHRVDGDRHLLCEGSITELGDAFAAWGMIMDALGHDAEIDLVFNKDDIQECPEIIFTSNENERKRNIHRSK